MADIKVNLDLSSLNQFLEKFATDIAKDVQKGIAGLASSTHTHILEEAKKKLPKWDLEKYEENLGQAEQINDYLWEITLKEPAAGIEEGRPAWDMKGPPGGLLHTERPGSKGEIQTTKDGRKYRIIPFVQGEVSDTSLNPNKIARQEALVKDIKNFLKTAGPKKTSIPLRKLEIDPRTGSPKIGRLHSFDISSAIPGKGNTPLLYGLTIHQTPHPKTGKVKRTITTFRTAIEGDGKWMRDPIAGKGLFDEARDWAEREWETEWLPKILGKYRNK